MELLIKIPKEFEQHFKQDAFVDSLNRLVVDAHLLAGLYEQETAKMLINEFKSAVPVPEPHGDLIDRDKLRAKEFIHDGDAYAVVMSRDIRNAPAVIPASKEGET